MSKGDIILNKFENLVDIYKIIYYRLLLVIISLFCIYLRSHTVF